MAAEANSQSQSNGAKCMEFKVTMACGGCKAAVTRLLTATNGVTAVDADVSQQRVLVTGTATLTADAVNAALAAWAKAGNKTVAYVKDVKHVGL